jgi:hypothetical protein
MGREIVRKASSNKIFLLLNEGLLQPFGFTIVTAEMSAIDAKFRQLQIMKQTT